MKSLTELDLSWSASTGATGYFIYRSLTPGGESTTALNATAVTTTTYKDLAVNSYTSYFYTVKAANSTGSSAASNEAKRHHRDRSGFEQARLLILQREQHYGERRRCFRRQQHHAMEQLQCCCWNFE